MKFLKYFLLALIVGLSSVCLNAQSGGTVPTLENGPWVWQGVNVYTPGKLQLSSPIAPCASGEFVTGLDATFSPICQIPSVAVLGSPVIYPVQCQQSGTIPSWCGASGQTADVYIRAACATLPSTGGAINLAGLTGTIAASVPCSTPTKMVILLQDPTVNLTVTESDGGIVFPQDNGSAFLGPGGVGQSADNRGIHLSGSANITAIVGPAHTDGTQESFTANGLTLFGATGATVTKGLLYMKAVYTNTTFDGNNVTECNNACAWVEDVGGMVQLNNNWFNVTNGNYSIIGSGLVIAANGSNGCEAVAINVGGGTIEHANGGANYPEISIKGNGAGALPCSVYVHDIYTERNGSPATPSTAAIVVQDGYGLSFTNILGGGTGTGADMINVSQTGLNRIQNVTFNNISNIFHTWTNTINDTTPLGQVIPFLTYPYVATYFSNPGYVQPPVLPGSTILSLGVDAMGGLGSFSTGSSNFGTSFANTGCLTAQGLTCTFTRTNATAPPNNSYSQEVQITANTDSSNGFNGVQYGPAVSFTAGQSYIATFWGKSDGTFTGVPTFLLWNSTVPVIYCQNQSSSAFTTTWTLYTFTCTPTTSGSSYLSATALTPAGATGTFWLGDFTFEPEVPLTSGAILTAVAPYGIGSVPGTLYSASGVPLPTCNAASNGSQFIVSDATSPTYMGAYSSGGGVTTAVICSYNGSYAWRTH